MELATEMVNRYLHSIEILLPRKQRRDIIEELSEDLRSQIEEKESALGRELNEAEVAEFLKQRGHPTKVAGNYLPQQYLIGPTLIPVYYFVLRIVLLWILAPLFGIILLGAIFAPPPVVSSLELTKFLGAIWDSMFYSVGAITIVFAMLEKFHVVDKTCENWDPRRLPRVPVSKTPDALKPMQRFTSGVELVAGVVAAAFWMKIGSAGATFDIGNGLRIGFDPVWQRTFWPIFVIILAGGLAGGVVLINPLLTQFRSAIRLGIHVSTFIIGAFLLSWKAGVQLTAPSLSAGELADATKWTNFGIWITLMAICAVAAVQALHEAWLIYKRTQVEDSVDSLNNAR